MGDATIGTAYVQIVPSTQGIAGSLTKAMSGEASSAGLTMGKLITGNILSSGLMSLGSEITGLISGINETNSAWSSFANNMAMSGMESTGIEAVKKDLQTFAAQTVYTSKDMAQTYAQLYAVNNETTTGLVKGFGAVAAAAENPAQAMKTMSTQATQMAAKPTVAWADFKLMLEQTPAGISQVAKVMGVTTKDLVAAVQDGDVATQDFFDAIETLGSDANGTLMQMATQYKTTGQAAEGLEATLQTKLAPTFQVLNDIGIQGITALTSGVSDFFNLATPIFEGVGDKIGEVAEKVLDLVENGGILNALFPELGGNIASMGLELLKDIIMGILDGIELVIEAIGTLSGLIEEHRTAFELLGVVIGTVTALYIALNAAQILAALSSAAETVALIAMYTAEGIAATATGILSGAVALLSAPFAPIILIIGTLIALGVIVAKNWDTIVAQTKEDIAAWGDIFGKFKNKLANIWNSIKKTTKEKWEAVKTAIVSPIQKARDKVKAILEKVKGFFPIKVGKLLKNLKLPHFSLSGKFSLEKGTVPKLSVDWYKTGGIFTDPSIIGVGEAGKEAVVPLSGSQMKPFAKAIASEIGGGGNTYNFGNITIDVSSLDDIATVEDFALMMKRAKAFA